MAAVAIASPPVAVIFFAAVRTTAASFGLSWHVMLFAVRSEQHDAFAQIYKELVLTNGCTLALGCCL